MRILIVDDEPLARSRLARISGLSEQYSVVGEAGSAEQAKQKILSCQPDIVLLDIAMPEVDGITLGKFILQLPTPPAIIFVTAHSEYALDAYQASPADYILKPVSTESLFKALERVGVQTKAHLEKKQQQLKLTFLQAGIKRQILISDIIYFNAEDKYVRMVTMQGEVLIEHSLAQLEQLFPDQLVRVHRQSLVNREYFKSMLLTGGQHWLVLHDNDTKLKVSRRAVATVRNALI